MELRVLKYFLAVAREESITGAARSLNLSQPTLSRQLRDMEDELGKPLFARSSRRIELTDEGRMLRKRAEEILALAERAEQEIAASDDIVEGDVYLGAGETRGVRFLASAMRSVQERYPQIRFHISSGDDQDVMEQIEEGLIDFGLIFNPVDELRYDFLRIPIEDRWVVLMRSDAPLAAKDTVTLQDLRGLPLILSRRIVGDVRASQWMERLSDGIRVAATYSLLFNASLMVEEGLGYAVCLDGIVNTQGNPHLCIRPLRDADPAMMHIIWKKYPVFSRAARKFLDALQRQAETPET